MAAEWPDWYISDTSAWQLASYVDAEATAAPLGSHLKGKWAGIEAGQARADELYGLIYDKGVRYARDPWNPHRFDSAGGGPRQRIRTPAEVLQGVGSCLDLSLVFAGMALAADMRAFVALTLDAKTPHALVVLDLAGSLSSRRESARGEGPGKWAANGAGRGVWLPESAPAQDATGLMPSWWRLSPQRWLAVDITRAATDDDTPRMPFGAACLAELPWAPEATWMLVDIDAALDGQAAYDPPFGRAAYPVHSYLPELPLFRDYKSRLSLIEGLRDDLAGRRAKGVVLQGDGGRGKSMLAQRLAWSADNGCGWFLNATNVSTLKASLAAAEQAELGQREEAGTRAERPNVTDVEQLAFAALGRLNSSDVPWVVVLDNCDIPPETSGLASLIPHSRQPGQVVILTTREAAWSVNCARDGWQFVEVPALEGRDMEELGLPSDMAQVAGDPLVAEPLSELAARGLAAHVDAGRDSRGLVWALVREALGHDSESVRLAKLLAWSPPDPLDITQAPIGQDTGARVAAAADLVRLRFVAPAGRSLAVGTSRGENGRDHVLNGVQLHRLFAEVIRHQTRQDDSHEVAEILKTLLTSPWGRRAFIRSADQTALQYLEEGGLQEATGHVTDRRTVGLVWQGLGHVRERRGPVSDSGQFFTTALNNLDATTDPYEVAEAEIGLARIVYQRSASTDAQLQSAQGRIPPARQLLESMPGYDARQLYEQGNALYWLIKQRLVAREKNPMRKLSLLIDVRDQLWRSFEQRLRIARHRPDGTVIAREAPLSGDGLGPERAYYNLAGIHLELAKARHESGRVWQSATALPGDVAADLDQAWRIYEEVAMLRARQYHDRPHPHHAACIHGKALVAYHRAVLLGQPGHLVEAASWVASGLEERWKVALGSPNITDDRIVADGDVGKSVALMNKISVAALMAAQDRPGHQVNKVLGVTADALSEIVNWRA